MRIKKLYISKYKNIVDQTFDFSNNSGYIALIGLNGSGKSNLIEAIAIIINGILNKKKIPFKYILQYDHDGRSYLRGSRIATIDSVKVKNSSMIYPSSVIACYSGEDSRLWSLAFEDYYMQYFKRAIDGKAFYPEFLFINKYCWSIALLSLMCSEKEPAKLFLKNTFGIDNLENVEVTFSFGNSENFKNHAALSWIKRIQGECLDESNSGSMKSIVSYDIPLLPQQSKEKSFFHHLYLLSQPRQNIEKGNSIDRYITNIDIKIDGISTNDYSEGHKKLILIECITQVLGDDASLLLLDEPDAHVHISMKKELLNCINAFEGQTVLTSHSPIFIEMMNYHNLLYLENGVGKNMDRIKAIREISNNEVNILDGAIIAYAKNLIITEGPDDIKHIKKAIEVLSVADKKLELLKKIPMVFQGGAKLVDEYYKSIIVKNIDNVEKVAFVFDYDAEGREAAKLVEKIGDKKIGYVFYNNTYPINPDNDFYLEDFYPSSAYSEIKIPEIETPPTYFQMKKMATISKSVKEKLQKKTDNNQIEDKYFSGFSSFLHELLKHFSLE